MATPLIETASPLLKPILIVVAWSGAASGEIVRICTYSGASTAGSSRTLPSEDECKRLASTENGASPFLSLATGIWCCSAKFRRSVRLLKDQSRHGAMILMSGFSA
ncbi:hypothetical protein D3C80_1209010 [compost metagenome]